MEVCVKTTLKARDVFTKKEVWQIFPHLVEDSFDVDRQVSVRAAKPSYDAEAQA